MAGARWGATRPRPRGSGRSVSEASQESPLRYSCASQFSIVIWLVRSRLPQPSRARSAKRPISPNRLLLKRERKGSGCVMRRNLPCLAGPGSRNGNTGRRVSQRATVPSSKTGREVTELGSGSPAWIRTTIHGSKGRCPTVRRPGSVVGRPSLVYRKAMAGFSLDGSGRGRIPSRSEPLPPESSS